MATASVFSYAQAAKGQTPTASTQQSATQSPNTTAPSVSSRSKDDSNVSTTGSASATATLSVSSNGPESTRVTQADSETFSLRKADSEIASVGDSIDSTGPSGDQNDAASVANSQSHGEKNTRRAGSSTRSGESVDGRKPRKTKKGRMTDKEAESEQGQEKDKEPEAPPKVELFEAPIPAVNFWQQRAQAQAAQKPKSNPAPTDVVAAALPGPSNPEDAKAISKPKMSTTDEPQASNGTSSIGSRPPKRVGETSRSTGDRPLRSGPRGSRLGDKEEKDALPPVEDTTLWPTPETAAVASDDIKRRPSDKPERLEKDTQDESGPVKPRQKKEWINMNIIPTVNFQTPLPTRGANRGSRGGGRGGREAGSRGAHNSASTASERPAAGSMSTKSPPENRDRPKENGISVRPIAAPVNATKRMSVDISGERVQRKSAQSTSDRVKDSTSDATAVASKNEVAKPQRSDAPQMNGDHTHLASRVGAERRSDLPLRGQEVFISNSREQGAPVRERTEPRGGRGGRMGHRGGSNGPIAMGHFQSQLAPSAQTFVDQGSMAPRGAQPLSPSVYSPYANFGSGSRSSNRTPRAQSGSVHGQYGGRVPPNSAAIGHKIPSVQPTVHGMDYSMQHSAYPYGYGWSVDPNTINIIMNQVEYYLSVDNLCKDTFLRKRMDSQGFVLLSTIASFNRMRAIAPEVDWIRIACEESEKIDYVQCEDGQDRLRIRDKWDRFVLNEDEREEEGRSPGPQRFWFRSKHSRQMTPYSGHVFNAGYPSATPTAYTSSYLPNGADPMFALPTYPNGEQFQPVVNGVNGNGVNGHRQQVESQLSAAVPEFSPGGANDTSNGLEAWNTKTDEEVAALCVIIHDSARSGQANGVANGEDADKSSPRSNGVHDTHEVLSSPEQSTAVTWFTEKKSSGQTAKYSDLRARGLEQRRLTQSEGVPRDMRDLYMFWQSFLMNDFNTGLYEEFRAHALDDSAKGASNKYGLKKLMAFYHEVILNENRRLWAGTRAYPEILDLHFEEAKKAAGLSSQLPNGVSSE